MDVKITILQVEVANLRPNPWNTNSVGAQNFEKLKGSIEKLGFFKPILARELDGGVFEILGGEHRWRAAMEQGISTVPVISVGKINDLVAKQMSLVDKMVRESLKSDAELRAKARAEKIEERRTRYDDWAFALGRMVMHEVATAKKDGRPLAAIEDDLKSLQRASGTLAKCFEISSKALGMDRAENEEDEIPNLVFGELTP